MKKLQKLATIFILGLVLLGGAHAADPALTPSGTVTLEIQAIALYTGETATPISKGIVTFNGKNYPFKVSAVSMGNRFGESTLKANGVIYGMTNISQIEGAFHVINSTGTWESGKKLLTITNQNGVTLLIHAVENGPLWIPTTGAIVTLLQN